MGVVWKRPPPPASAGGGPGGGAPPLEPPPPPESRTATLIFILGLLGVVLCCLPLGPVALLLGIQERNLVKAGRVARSDLLTAGWILGIVGTVFFTISLVYVIWSFADRISSPPRLPPGST
jgi:membrane protein implicated in regulation of membrane protease activity